MKRSITATAVIWRSMRNHYLPCSGRRPRGHFLSSLSPTPPSLPSPVTVSHADLVGETLYIIDGTALLYKSFYGLGKQKYYANLTTLVYSEQQLHSHSSTTSTPTNTTTATQDPLPCGAVAAMATAFTRFCRDVQPSHVAVVFDAGRVTFRNRLYPLYKQQRPEVCGVCVRECVCV